MRFWLLFLILLIASACHATEPVIPSELMHGWNLLNNGRLIEALTTIKEYSRAHPESREGLFLLAMTRWRIMWLSGYNEGERGDLLLLLDEVQNKGLPDIDTRSEEHTSELQPRVDIS